VDAVRALEDAGAAPLARLSLGVHAVVPLEQGWRGAVALFDGAGTAIALPWQGMLLVGATDEAYDGDPGSPVVDPAQLDAVLGRLAAVLPPEQLAPSRVVHAFAGLRALPLGAVATARARRRHVLGVGPAGMVSIAGGKLTTHRVIAADALRRLPSEVRPRLVRPADEPLGRRCDPAETARLRARVDPAVARHLSGLYGADALRVVAGRLRAPDALEPIHPDGPDIWAQVDFARDEEWALTAEDVAARRTTLAVRGLASPAVLEAVESRLADAGRSPLEVGVL
jgi:glycerol-3-phosphate dehydrogenase